MDTEELSSVSVLYNIIPWFLFVSSDAMIDMDLILQ